jgi:glyoxylase-like metal-dependent hydrolase (beta-lactamase superfamily II)
MFGEILKLDQISDSVFANTEGKTGGNVGLIILDDRALAVDAQFPVSAYDFRRSISSVTAKPITHLLLTHIHGDHIFGNQAFEDCEIISHRRLKEKMEENLQTIWAPGNLEKMIDDMKKNRPERAELLEGLRIVLPTNVFEEKFMLENIELTHLGGHTDCSSIVYVPDDKLLFAGDIVFAKTFPWAGDPTADPDTWIEAFKAILKMPVEKIVPGHGPICHKQEIKFQLSWFQSVRDNMKKLIEEGASEVEAAQFDGYPEFYESDRMRRENSLKHWYNVLKDKE